MGENAITRFTVNILLQHPTFLRKEIVLFFLIRAKIYFLVKEIFANTIRYKIHCE